MRRIVSLTLILALAFLTIGLTEQSVSLSQSYLDSLSSMDYESLLALAAAINTELVSRPEAQPLVLSEGMYLVGSDIAPGIYYFTSPDPNQDGDVEVYTSKTTYENRESQLGTIAGRVCNFYVSTGDTERVILESGNLIEVRYPIVLCSDKQSAESYYTYTPPEGTYVPAGIYTVGIEIPEGVYKFYSSTGYNAGIEIYERGKRIEKLIVTSDYEIFKLLEGYEIKVNSDIIMTKQTSFNFE